MKLSRKLDSFVYYPNRSLLKLWLFFVSGHDFCSDECIKFMVGWGMH